LSQNRGPLQGKKLHLTVVSAKSEDGQRRYSVTA